MRDLELRRGHRGASARGSGDAGGVGEEAVWGIEHHSLWGAGLGVSGEVLLDDQGEGHG